MGIEDKVRDTAAPLAAAEGVELLEVRYVQEGPHRVLRLTIERPNAPTSLADCEAVSRAVEAALDAMDTMPERYRLEVTSAGLTRPLRTLPDFARAAGGHVRLVLRNGAVLTGLLRAAGEGGMVLGLPDGSERLVQLDEVSAARREVTLFASPPPAGGGRKR